MTDFSEESVDHPLKRRVQIVGAGTFPLRALVSGHLLETRSNTHIRREGYAFVARMEAREIVAGRFGERYAGCMSGVANTEGEGQRPVDKKWTTTIRPFVHRLSLPSILMGPTSNVPPSQFKGPAPNTTTTP